MNNEQKERRINELRKKLEDLIGYYDLTDPKVIKASKKLDNLIYKHQKFGIKNRLPKDGAK